MRVKKRHLKIAAGILLAIILIIIIIYFLPAKEVYSVDAQGFLHAPTKTDLHATRTLLLSDENVTEYHVTFESQGATIYGLLFIPKQTTGQGMLLLPGGGVTKDAEAKTARQFAHRGFIVLTIDQRGVGETGGNFNNIENDFYAWKAGQIPTMHLLILDALAGIQFLKEQPETKEKILLSGESMGGRAAMVAARLSPDISGLLVISSSGFGNPSLTGDEQRFFTSFNPDANLQLVHVPVVFVHSTNDTTIPIALAQATFNIANQPKKFYTIDGCPHGYCAAMEQPLDDGLAVMHLQ